MKHAKEQADIVLSGISFYLRNNLTTREDKDLEEEVINHICDITHDATEGLVPVEDVLPLVDAVMDGRSGIKQLQELRAKHPNLFTK